MNSFVFTLNILTLQYMMRIDIIFERGIVGMWEGIFVCGCVGRCELTQLLRLVVLGVWESIFVCGQVRIDRIIEIGSFRCVGGYFCMRVFGN